MTGISAAEGLRRLIEGNERFAAGTSAQQPPAHDRLIDLARAQHPFASILGCSDSRVPPELLFYQGPGDLFIVRVAGNVVGTETLGSLGYALAHLGTPLFVVLGHEGCGAVQAAVQTRHTGPTEHGAVAEIVDAILPALDGIDQSAPPEAQLHLAVEENVRWALRQLAARPVARAALAQGTIQLVGAVYELASGQVRIL